MAKKKTPPPTPVKRLCDCWIGKMNAETDPEPMSCFCEMDDSEFQSIRFSVQKDGEVHSRWGTLQEALSDGRSRVGLPFDIYDNLEQRIILTYQ